MKMKNMLIGGMSLALVACISIGGTLAYLTATAKSVTNTFTFVGKDSDYDGVINVKLEEDQPALGEAYGGATASWNEVNNGYDYKDVLPNQELPKEPKVSVHTNTDAYVFVRVTDADTNPGVTAKMNSEEWIAVGEETTNEDGTKTQAYYYKEKVLKTADGTDWESIASPFTTVTVANIDTVKDGQTVELNDVKIEIAAIQSATFENQVKAYEALGDADWQPVTAQP